MTLKWITDSYTSIDPNHSSNEEIIGLSINGREYLPGDDDELCVLTEDLKGFPVNLLPINLCITPTNSISKYVIDPSYNIYCILFNGIDLECTYEFYAERNEPDNTFDNDDLQAFKEICTKVKNNNKYTIDQLDDEDNYKQLLFTESFNANCQIETIIRNIAITSNAIFDDTYSNIPQYYIGEFNGLSEESFTLDYVIPAFKKLGFLNVQYTHGPTEFGKDVIYQYTDNFGTLNYGAAQVKKDNISGSATSIINTIINQLDDAFRLPYIDLKTRSKVNISQFAIVCSGKYSDNAKEKIVNKVSRSQCINFLEGQDIIDILNQK